MSLQEERERNDKLTGRKETRYELQNTNDELTGRKEKDL